MLIPAPRSLPPTIAALAVLAASAGAAQPSQTHAPPFDPGAVAFGALQGASFNPLLDTDQPDPSRGGAAGAMSPVMALDVVQGASIARIRAPVGGAQFQPTVTCGQNLNLPSGYVGDLTVLSGGACAATQQPAH